MPSNKSSNTSNYSIYKPFGGYHGFMASYGLKPWDLDDVEEGKAILEGLKKCAEMEEDDKRQKGGNKK